MPQNCALLCHYAAYYPEGCCSHLLHGGSLKSCNELPAPNLSHSSVCSDRFLCCFSRFIQHITKPASWWGGEYCFLNSFQLIIFQLSFPSKPYISSFRQHSKINHTIGMTWGSDNLNFLGYDATWIGSYQSFEAVCFFHHQGSPRSITWDLMQRVCLLCPGTQTGSLVRHSIEPCSIITGCNHWQGWMINVPGVFK
jgi:hypothetical protein